MQRLSKASMLIFFLIVFVLFSKTHSQMNLQYYEDNWNTLSQIEGKLYQTNTMFKDPKCNPCDYLLRIYEKQIILNIISPINNQINSFGLKILSQTQQEGFAFDEKSYNLSNNQNQKISQSLTRFVTDRITWEYQFTLPYEGIIIKGNYQDNHYITAIFSIIFTIVSFVLLPLRTNFLKTLTNMIYKRTSFLSMIIISQNLHFLLIYYAATTIKYLLWENKFLVKFIWYGVFMSTLSILIIHTILFYSAMQKKYNETSDKRKLSPKAKNIILMLIFLLGIIIFDIILLYIQKQILFYYYFTLSFIIQVGYSIKNKVYPHLPTTIYSFLASFTLLILANILPMFKFEQTTRFDITIFMIYCLVIFAIGSFSMKYFIGLQNLVEFQCANQQNTKQITEQGKRNSQMEIVQRQM